MNIAVFGLGYVGMVNIACLSKLRHTLYGCDVKPHKVDLISKGKSTILEPQIDELMAAGFAGGLIKASTDAYYCVEHTEMALVCVGTPSDQNGNVNLSYILNTAREIAAAVKKLNKRYTLVFRSTIPPGTIEEIIAPEILKALGESLKDLNIVFLPEFLREGSAVKDFFNGARIVIGLDAKGKGKEEMEKIFSFSENIPLVFTNYKTAEFVKYVDNAFHATKVTFANEIYSIGSSLGVNVKEANDIFLMDDILNISGRYLKPGTPFGGSCLPKDTRAIVHLAEQAKIEIPFFRGLIQSNDVHQKRLVNKVLEFKKSKVLIFGLTFKQNTDDVRESPFLFLLKTLIQEGCEVKVVDPKLNIMALRVELPEIIKYLDTDLNVAAQWAELVVVNSPNIAAVVEAAGKNKLLINCFDNENHSKISPLIHNLF